MGLGSQAAGEQETAVTKRLQQLRLGQGACFTPPPPTLRFPLSTQIYQNEEIKSCVLMISVDPNKDLKPFLPSFLECGPEIKDTDMTRLQPIPVASQKMSPRVDVPGQRPPPQGLIPA